MYPKKGEGELGWLLVGRRAAASSLTIIRDSSQTECIGPTSDHPHAITATKEEQKTLLVGPLGHAPLDRRRGQVELVVQRLLHQIQQRALDGAEDHLLEGRIT